MCRDIFRYTQVTGRQNETQATLEHVRAQHCCVTGNSCLTFQCYLAVIRRQLFTG